MDVERESVRFRDVKQRIMVSSDEGFWGKLQEQFKQDHEIEAAMSLSVQQNWCRLLCNLCFENTANRKRIYSLPGLAVTLSSKYLVGAAEADSDDEEWWTQRVYFVARALHNLFHHSNADDETAGDDDEDDDSVAQKSLMNEFIQTGIIETLACRRARLSEHVDSLVMVMEALQLAPDWNQCFGSCFPKILEIFLLSNNEGDDGNEKKLFDILTRFISQQKDLEGLGIDTGLIERLWSLRDAPSSLPWKMLAMTSAATISKFLCQMKFPI